MFIDHAQIIVKAGDGGRGCSAFAQPPYIRFPYPDGGDGGDGGHVTVEADPNVATLLDFHYRHEFTAGRGGHGGSNKKTGKRGADLVIRVPVGTVIRDAETGALLRDLTRNGQQVVIASGGPGGLGNATAQEATPGSGGQQRRLTLELKLIADVGIIGFPNAGKSSLLSRISSARPKVGAYPFTTRYPVLGVVEVPGRGPSFDSPSSSFDRLRTRPERGEAESKGSLRTVPSGSRGTFVACDIPGLIEGAHEGKGLGVEFLRHIERTRLLVHLIDMAAVDGRNPLEAYRRLNQELEAYSPALRAKPQLIVANKMDVPEAAEYFRAFQETMGESADRIWPITCATGAGIPALLQGIWEALSEWKNAQGSGLGAEGSCPEPRA